MRKLILVLGALGGLAAMMTAGWLREPQPWTTDDTAARNAFRDCLEADMKFYLREALAACEMALDRDPDFAAAKLKVALLSGLSSQRSRSLLAELRGADLGRLQATERFLVRYWLLRADRDEEVAEDLLGAYLADNPDDPFALDLHCRELWTEREWDAAERCHTRLLEVDPNWVQAQNRRGYAAMAQGRFDEAEDHFRTYLYVAPDQANPHDSLAELLTLRGRYDEAERELEMALEIRPDFCAAYQHLVTLHLLQDRPERARRALERAAAVADCLDDSAAGARDRCAVDLWERRLRDDWEGVRETSGACVDHGPDGVVLGHRAALETGHQEEALAIEAGAREQLEEERSLGYRAEGLGAILAHLHGVRMLYGGSYDEAVAQLRVADASLRYWDVLGGSVFKLYNLAILARAEELAGDERAAQATRRRLEEINPRFLREAAVAR
jgi:tetratricopeptide (TPR) repeat protein